MAFTDQLVRVSNNRPEVEPTFGVLCIGGRADDVLIVDQLDNRRLPVVPFTGFRTIQDLADGYALSIGLRDPLEDARQVDCDALICAPNLNKDPIAYQPVTAQLRWKIGYETRDPLRFVPIELAVDIIRQSARTSMAPRIAAYALQATYPDALRLRVRQGS